MVDEVAGGEGGFDEVAGRQRANVTPYRDLVFSPSSLRARLELVIRPRVQGTGCPRPFSTGDRLDRDLSRRLID